MGYTVSKATVVFPDKKAPSSFASAWGSNRKPQAHIEIELEEGYERTLWIPVRVARIYVKEPPTLPMDLDDFRARVDALCCSCAFTLVTEMLSRRDHASGEVRDKLAIYGFSRPAIDDAIKRAQAYRFINDDRFCSFFIEERKRRGWGRRKIETELKRRHIDLDAIPGYPEQYFNDEDDLDRALHLLERRRVPEERAFEKLVRFLMGKGFSYRVAADAAKAKIGSARELD